MCTHVRVCVRKISKFKCVHDFVVNCFQAGCSCYCWYEYERLQCAEAAAKADNTKPRYAWRLYTKIPGIPQAYSHEHIRNYSCLKYRDHSGMWIYKADSFISAQARARPQFFGSPNDYIWAISKLWWLGLLCFKLFFIFHISIFWFLMNMSLQECWFVKPEYYCR